MTIIKNKYYPSSSGFMVPAGTMSDYSSGCLRYILVSSKQRGPELDPLFMMIGEHHEDLYRVKLGDKVEGVEVVVKSDITPLTEFSGRMDFVTKDKMIHETKASFSNSFYLEVIRDGKFKLSHLSQIVCYMIDKEQSEGVIACGYYELDSAGQFVQSGYREFRVSIDADGKILVDGEHTGYDVFQQLAHRHAAARVLENQEVAGRPANIGQYTSPCHFCPLARTCDSYDEGSLSKEEFIAKGIDDIKNQTPMKAKPRGITKRRVKK